MTKNVYNIVESDERNSFGRFPFPWLCERHIGIHRQTGSMLFRNEHEKPEVVFERDSNGFKSDEPRAKTSPQKYKIESKRQFGEERYSQVSRPAETVARFSLPRDYKR